MLGIAEQHVNPPLPTFSLIVLDINLFKTRLGPTHEIEKESNMKNIEDEEDDLTGDSWMHKKLKFESEDPVLAKDANTKDDDWFDIYDPRNPLNKRRREKKKT